MTVVEGQRQAFGRHVRPVSGRGCLGDLPVRDEAVPPGQVVEVALEQRGRGVVVEQDARLPLGADPARDGGRPLVRTVHPAVSRVSATTSSRAAFRSKGT